MATVFNPNYSGIRPDKRTADPFAVEIDSFQDVGGRSIKPTKLVALLKTMFGNGTYEIHVSATISGMLDSRCSRKVLIRGYSCRWFTMSTAYGLRGDCPWQRLRHVNEGFQIAFPTCACGCCSFLGDLCRRNGLTRYKGSSDCCA